MALKSYRELVVWQKSMDLCDMCYRLTERLPAEEKYGLKAQIRDAATSIPSNIAEGYGRKHRGDYLHHVSMALGSLAEVETRLLICLRQEFISRAMVEPVWKTVQETGRMLGSLHERLAQGMNRDPVTGRMSASRKRNASSVSAP